MEKTRKIYIQNDELSLVEYITEIDAKANYECWLDIDTQRGYNFMPNFTYEEFVNTPKKTRFNPAIMRNSDSAIIGVISLSPENTLPDLAIMLYKPYRGKGYSIKAFNLALKYCFEQYGFNEIYAGCYETNEISLKMLSECGFVPHPETNCNEKHFLDGTPIVQLDFVKYRNQKEVSTIIKRLPTHCGDETCPSCVVAGDFIFLAHHAGGFEKNDIAYQTRVAFEAMKNTLASVGATLDDMVQLNYYIKYTEDFCTGRDVFAEYFSNGAPARMTVVTQFLDENCLCQIDGIAYKSRGMK